MQWTQSVERLLLAMEQQTAVIGHLAQSVAAQAAAIESMVDAMLDEAGEQDEDDEPARDLAGRLIS